MSFFDSVKEISKVCPSDSSIPLESETLEARKLLATTAYATEQTNVFGTFLGYNVYINGDNALTGNDIEVDSTSFGYISVKDGGETVDIVNGNWIDKDDVYEIHIDAKSGVDVVDVSAINSPNWARLNLISTKLGAHGDVYNGATAATEFVEGEAGDDWIKVGPGEFGTRFPGAVDNIVKGGSGEDTIYGASSAGTLGGNDQLYGEGDDDKIFAKGGIDHVYGGVGNDELSGGDNNDFIFGGADDDSILGDQGHDSAWGGAGDDSILGDLGDDSLYGGIDGADTIYGELPNGSISTSVGVADHIWGGGEDDKLYGDNGNDFVYGGAGNDVMGGGSGNDYLRGFAGNDEMYGGDDNDTLIDTTGFDQDSLWGGGGTNTGNVKDGDYGWGGKDDEWTDVQNMTTDVGE